MSVSKSHHLTPAEQNFVKLYAKVHGPPTANSPRRGTYIKLLWTPLQNRVQRQFEDRIAIVQSTLDDGITYASIAEGDLELVRTDFTLLDNWAVTDDEKTQLTLVNEQSFRLYFNKGLQSQQVDSHVPPSDPTRLRCGSIVVHCGEFADASLGVVVCVLNDTNHAVVVWVDDTVWYRREKLERLARASPHEVARQPRLRRDRIVRFFSHITEAFIFSNSRHQMSKNYEIAIDHLRFTWVSLYGALPAASLSCIEIDDKAAERCVENMLLDATNTPATNHTARNEIKSNNE